MNDTPLRYRLAFSMLKNINASLASQLLAKLGSEESFFTMSASELASLCRLDAELCHDFYRRELLERAKAEERFVMSHDIDTMYFDGEYYPTRLANCSDAPAMLYMLGQTNLEAAHIVSIVGTRHATPHGIETTNRIVGELAQKIDDLVIVSGLAYGIDIAAHKAAIANNIPTIAVMANPLNTIYPSEHRGVAVQMLRNGGALISEYSTSDAIYRLNFLARNRIVAGLSDATIVVESDIKGGSLFTANVAARYNREVFAVPGRITDKYSRGAIGLIASNKAHIFSTTDNFIEEMGWDSVSAVPEPALPLEINLTQNEQRVYDYLVTHPGSRVSEIMLNTNIPSATLKDLLFEMEMKDLIMSMAGGLYSAL